MTRSEVVALKHEALDELSEPYPHDYDCETGVICQHWNWLEAVNWYAYGGHGQRVVYGISDGA